MASFCDYDNKELNIFDLKQEIEDFSFASVMTDEFQNEKHFSLLSTPAIMTEMLNREKLEQLSFEAKGVLWIILQAPTDMQRTIGIPLRISQRSLKKYLHQRLKWPHKIITETFKEIKRFLRD